MEVGAMTMWRSLRVNGSLGCGEELPISTKFTSYEFDFEFAAELT